MSQKSFLLVSHELTYTGAPRSLFNLAKILLEEGHRVSVWSLETGTFFAEFMELGVDVRYITGEKLKNDDIKSVTAEFDMVVCNTVFCAGIAYETQKYVKTVLLSGEARNIKKIVTDHSIDVRKLRSVKNIVCVSAYAKRALEKFLNRNDLVIIHNYIEEYFYRGGLYKTDKKIHFIVSGTVEPRKGQDLAVSAFLNIPPELRREAVLHIAGNVPAWSGNYFKGLDTGDSVVYHNEIRSREDLFELYRGMDVFIVSSRDEACSMVALEAAMLGKALIVSSHVGGGYICRKKYHFKSGDVSDLQSKMLLFLNAPDEIASAGAENRRSYEKYAAKKVIKKEWRRYLYSTGVLSSYGTEDRGIIEKADAGRSCETDRLHRVIKNNDKKIKTGNRTVIPVVLATDTNYAPFAAAVIRSVFDNRSDDCFYNIYVLYDDTLTHNMFELLVSLSCEDMAVRLINVSDCFSEDTLYLSGHYSMQMYYRWLIPELFKHYDKVLYLDCDISLLDDVAELYNTDIGNACLGMVPNTVRTSFKNYVENVLELDVDEYYNSGVILFNTKIFTEKGIKNKCLDFINRDRDLLCPDQDAVNVCCRGNIFRLPDEWNFQWHHMIPGVETGGFVSDHKKRYDRMIKKGPKIIHYTSYKKPWNEPDIRFADVFWRFFREVPGYERIVSKYRYGKNGLSPFNSNQGTADAAAHYNARIDFLQKSLDETRNSATYKIGRALTSVPRRIRHVLTGAPV